MRNPTRLTTTKIQGADSFVTITTLTWRERKASDAAVQEAEATGQKYDFIWAKERVIRDHVVDWNWTDERGVELPKPSKCSPEEFADVLDAMNSQEIEFLYNAITSATPERLKN